MKLKEPRCNKYKLGFAYSKQYLYSKPSEEEYYKAIEYELLYEFDKRDLPCPERDKWKRCERVKLKMKFYNNQRDTSPAEIKRYMSSIRRRLGKEYKENDGFLPITDNLDRDKLIRMILNTYPDPAFFGLTGDWTGKKMKFVFGVNDDSRCFRVRVTKDAVIRIRSLKFSTEEYQKAINTFINSARWKYLYKEDRDVRFDAYNLRIEYDGKASINMKMSNHTENISRIKDNRYFYFGIYNCYVKKVTKNKIEKGEELIKCKFPRYKSMESKYRKKNLKGNPDFTIYPLTGLMDFRYELYKKEFFYDDYYKFKREWNHLSSVVNNKAIGFSDATYPDKIVLRIRYCTKKGEEMDMFYVLEESIRNAKIAIECNNFYRNQKKYEKLVYYNQNRKK